MKTNWGTAFLLIGITAVLGGCASMPSGPNVMVLPGTGKSFEAFQADDAVCRQWASQQTGKNPKSASNENLASGAGLGALAGAGLGAAIGAVSGNAAAGAAIGGGSGLILGTGAAANSAQSGESELQRRYDNAYQECMYAKGNQIPGYVNEPKRTYRTAPPPPPPNSSTVPPAPPPPAGATPPATQ